MKTNRGFTLVELMITLVVAAIMLGWGVPSFLTIIENNRIATQANSFIAALALARSEAVSKGATTRVEATGGDWAGGWKVTRVLSGGGTEDLRVFEALTGQTTFTSTQSITALQFTSKGYLDVATGTVYDFVMKSPKCTGNNARKITITAVGRPAIEHVACG
ncbi:MAG TPA: prepilin-type N-terminal cleavage/methylation domain-containing protein [Thioalkalivibrio sp.]|nr:prepilin-type N-terminal cleavage/methylation domain-containing protein [Thioalkalivibrio sp.]